MTTSPSSYDFKLFVDWNHRRGQRDALRCMMVSSILGVTTEVVKGLGLDSPQLKMKSDSSILASTSYAITRYLLSTAKMHPFSLSHTTPSSVWVIESLVFWSLSELDVAVDGVDREAIHRTLSLLSCSLRESTSGFLVQESLTLADIFVWTALTTSRVLSNPLDFLESRPNIKDYMERVSATTSAQFALASLEFPGMIRSVQSIDSPQEKFYLTTAINYTNGPPHIGHAYEAICADVICRYHRIYGRDVFFLTGTDEHGQKIAQTAEKLGSTPIALCDMYADQFKALNASLTISNDFFIRTTSPQHKGIAQTIWTMAKKKGDIYLDTYSGWYNVREETFVTEFEAQASDYLDPVSGVPLQKMEEVSYFFKMSKYHQQLMSHIQAHPEFIQPDFRRNEILSRLKEPLQDLSASRTTFDWGISIPGDDKHVMYVWFDALTNYLSGVGYTTENLLARYWPANVHVIGKDITWFHCVIWPCILMSCGIPLPKTVLGHGFVLAADGKKMSKSLGNVVDPVELLKQWPNAETIRFYMIKAAELGRDVRFDVDAMVSSHNDLADTLGNLVHRVTGLCEKFCNGSVPDFSLPEGEPPFDFDFVASQVECSIQRLCLQEALELMMQATRDTNKYLTDRAPWGIKDHVEKQRVCRAVLEALYLLAHLLEPFIPLSSEQIFQRLGSPRMQLRCLSGWFDNLKASTPVTIGEVLFQKRDAVVDANSSQGNARQEKS